MWCWITLNPGVKCTITVLTKASTDYNNSHANCYFFSPLASTFALHTERVKTEGE